MIQPTSFLTDIYHNIIENESCVATEDGLVCSIHRKSYYMCYIELITKEPYRMSETSTIVENIDSFCLETYKFSPETFVSLPSRFGDYLVTRFNLCVPADIFQQYENYMKLKNKQRTPSTEVGYI